MKKLMLFESYTELIQEKKKEKKDLKWIHKAIKKPGALHKALGVPKDEKISMDKIDSKIKELKDALGHDDEKLIHDKRYRKLLRRLTLAKALKEM